MHVCTLQNLAMYREVFPHLLICLLLSEQHLVIPEGSFLVPEIGILFGDAVGASLVGDVEVFLVVAELAGFAQVEFADSKQMVIFAG